MKMVGRLQITGHVGSRCKVALQWLYSCVAIVSLNDMLGCWYSQGRLGSLFHAEPGVGHSCCVELQCTLLQKGDVSNSSH
jgi:hypothetical protein